MRIGELARATGVDVETVRYYERAGLLRPPQRGQNGYRAYGRSHVEHLAFVRHCRALDMPLADVRRLLEFVARPADHCRDIDHLIEGQLARVRARLKSMRALERQLAQLRKQCAAGDTPGDCGILQELVAAAHGEGCACHGSPPPSSRPRPRPPSGPRPATRRSTTGAGSACGGGALA
ncbi:MAG: Cd(II)/Pb(II)-responsive transcriptional regulator [Vicinamibacterales bacterium]